MKDDAKFAHEYPVLIREAHLDVFGHVNNASYLQIFEEARWDWITRGGFGMKEIFARGIGPVVLEANLRFQREATNRQAVVVKSRTLEYKGKIGTVEQVMVRADGRSLARGVGWLAPFIADKDLWLKTVHRTVPGPDGAAKPAAEFVQPDVTYWEHWPVRQPFLVFGPLATGRRD